MDPGLGQDVYSFAKLTDIPSSVTLSVRIGSLQGDVRRSSTLDLLEHPERITWGINDQKFPPFYLTLRLYSNNKPLTPVYRTPYKHFKKAWQWNHAVDLGFPIRELPLDAQLGITVWDTGIGSQDGGQDRVIGGTTLRLFGSKGTLKKAQQRCQIHLGVSADGSVNSETDSRLGAAEGANSEMKRLEKLIKRHERMDLPPLKWLDKQTYRVIETIHDRESQAITNQLWLYVDLPRLEWPVVWCEDEASTATNRHRGFGASEAPPSTSTTLGSGPGGPGAPTTSTNPATATGSLNRPHTSAAPLLDRSFFTIPDPESQRENPIEAKHRRLVRAQRSRRRGIADGASSSMTPAHLALARDLKPDKTARDQVEDIIASPPTRELTDKESDLLWTYRFYLTKIPRALTKFLKAVSWTDSVESRMAVEQVLPLWGGGGSGPESGSGQTATRSAVEIGDVLELLGPAGRMMHRAVRTWAVQRLAEHDDEELGLYLLQLVQALKLDEREEEEKGLATASSGTASSSVRSKAQERSLGPLSDFLIARALGTKASSLLFTFYWYLSVECSDERWGTTYKRTRRRLEKALETSQPEVLSSIHRQERMVSKLGETARALRASKDPRPKKIEKLKEILKDGTSLGLPAHDDSRNDRVSLPLPLDPRITATRVVSEKCSVFKSNLYPLLVYLEVDSSITAAVSTPAQHEYAFIFKSGDDLRQDQLVLQLFQLMDRLLLNENLDLKLTPYRVLATSAKEGMVQFVPSRTLANIMGEWGSLAQYLRHAQDKDSAATNGRASDNDGQIKGETMDRFVRSCAGYCVVTYLLGVGDRHLDNLLLTPDGRFFHVDFGYILNRDPKPFPPPVKVSKEMVDCMGGPSSPNYARFRQLCFTAFSILRKNSSLILNLIGLMTDANVGDIKVEPDRAVPKVLEKFRLDLSESDARAYFDDLLQQSSYLTVVFDRLHDAAQFFRS